MLGVPHGCVGGTDFFACRSIFTPTIEIEEDAVDFEAIQKMEEELKKPKKPKYLAGEKLLIKMARERSKTKKNKKKQMIRINESAERVLSLWR